MNLTEKIRESEFYDHEIDKILEIGLTKFINYGGASNNWVISGKHTKSGSPLLANDPHLTGNLPPEWYQLRISYESKGKSIRAVGYSIAGIPFLIGKTDYYSMGVTTNVCDGIELFD